MGVRDFFKRLFGDHASNEPPFRPGARYTARLVTGKEAEEFERAIKSGEAEPISFEDLKRELDPGAYVELDNSSLRGLLDPETVQRMRRKSRKR